jgi:Phage protein
LIQSWCTVSRQTAYLYKIGARKPSRQALRLFVLNRDGRVLGDDWDGWAVHRGKLVDPDGNETTRDQLRAYWLMLQLARELTSRDSKRLEEYWRLLGFA